ncbi:MAG: hypothetical protein ACYCZZ_00170 [Minisyncoccota bacterium]
MRRRPMSALDIALVSLVLVVLLIFGWVAAKYWYPGSWVQHQVERLVKTEPSLPVTPPKLIRFQTKVEQPKVAQRPTHPIPIRKRKAKHPVSKLATSAAAKHSTKVVRWQHWGAAPYAHSLAEACQKAPTAIDGTSMPEAVKEHFKKALGDCKGGTTVWLTPNQPLEQMWSGGQHPHIMNHVVVAELPVLRSPDGRAYRKGAVAEAAKAFEWSYVYEGKTYLWDIPLVCFNESWRFGHGFPAEKCVELSFNAPVGGNVRWGVGSTEGPLPPSACNAQRQDSLAWTAWLGECDVCIPALGDIRGILGATAEIPHKYLYPAIARKQTLRFSTAIWSRVVYICLEYPDGTQTCGVYMRPQDWRGRYHADIPDNLWIKDDGNCPTAAH